MTSWAILTGEYPPKLGGVADYTRLVARGLAAAGDDVEVFAPSASAPFATDSGVEVTTVPGGWGIEGLAFVGARLRGRRVLVQYVAQAFGMKGMNLPFVAWLLARREPLWVMFHEVAWPLRRGDTFRRTVLGVVTHGMAGLLAARAERAFVSIPEWNDWLRRANPLARTAEWLPIPSTVATSVPPEAVAAVRARHGIGDSDEVVGYFGTLGFTVAPYLEGVLERVGRDPSRVLLVLGPRGPELRARLEAKTRARILAPGRLGAEEVAAHIKACTLVAIPQSDGVSSRRTSVMAALALGVPVVTNDGALTDPIWRDGAVGLARSPAPDAVAGLVTELLGDPARCAAIGARGRALYESRFSLEQTVAALRSTEAPR